MSDGRDPAIKLFGKMIPMPESGKISDPAPGPPSEPSGDEEDVSKDITFTKDKAPMPGVPDELPQSKPASSSNSNNGNQDDHQTCTQDVKATADPKPKQDRAEADTSGQEKVLKKPDKVLSCPRCNSLDTKFCYYNNYNVNQPRHFCKNCQRYWTAGGAMRNVPVGAGRRKSKQSASHCRQLMMPSDGLPCLVAPDSTHQQALSVGLSAPMWPLKGNGAALKNGTEAPLCESMAYVLNRGDQKRNTDMGSVACGENREEPTCESSVTVSNCVENENDCAETSVHEEQNRMQGCSNGISPMHHLQWYPGPPLVFPWSPEWNSVSAMMASWCSSELFCRPENGSQNPASWTPPPMFCQPTAAFPFVPAAFWGCMPSSPNGTWNVPWVRSNDHLSPSSSTGNSGCSANGSPTLGKHSRDTGLEGEERMEKSLWIPKTLRIDDPDEAAKNSIWATLGIKPNESIKMGGIFKAFQSKTESKDHITDTTQVVHANPVALCRSQTFQEST